jgi:hypothetical protein
MMKNIIMLNLGPARQNSFPSVTTLGHMTIYGYQPKASIEHRARRFGRLAVSRLRILCPATFGPSHVLEED